MRWMPVALVLLLRPHAQCADMPVRGWLIHTGERSYVLQVLQAARSYRINHLELSHAFVHNVDDVLERPGLAVWVEETARRARRQGIEAFIWSHELNTREENLILDPGTPRGRAFWEARKEAYRQALRRCPSVSGVVLMFGSCPTEVWDPRIKDSYWVRLSWAQRVRFVTRQVQSVVCGEMHRRLWVRDFNHSPAQLRALVQGLRDFPGITVSSKAEPQDFQLFYPHSFSIGAFGRTPQVLELDLNGEYWGQSAVPVSLVRYLRYRIGYGYRRGVIGGVGRIDTDWNRALGTPSEINLYAFTRLLQNPSTSVQAIYDGWIHKRYGLRPGSPPAMRLQTILDRTLDFAKATYYTLGFWTPKNQSTMPASMESITSCLISKSTALWDPKYGALEQRLRHPDGAIVQRILREKERAIAIADENCRLMETLRPHLRPADYRDLATRLRLAASVARLYRDVAFAFWNARLVQERRLASGTPVLSAAANTLLRWTERIEEGHVPLPNPTLQARNLRQFAGEVRRAGGSTQRPPNQPSPTFSTGITRP